MAKEARIEILKGNDAGAQFRVTGNVVRLGRSADSDIVVTDASVSRNHAELNKVNESFVIKDLNSSNGVFVNGKKIKEHYLISGDVFTIGNHEYRYVEKEVVAPATYQASNLRNSDGGTIPGISVPSREVNVPVSSASGKGLKNKRVVIYGSVLLVVILFFILSPSGKKAADNNNNTQLAASANQNVNGDMPPEESEEAKIRKKIPDDEKELFDRASEHYFDGQREYRLQNYSRALEEFRKAVSFYPQHTRARTAAGQTAKKIEEESQRHLSIGKKMFSQKRYEDALRHFDDVLNLNYRQADSALFKEAEKWKKLTEKRKGEVFEQ